MWKSRKVGNFYVMGKMCFRVLTQKKQLEFMKQIVEEVSKNIFVTSWFSGYDVYIN